MVRQDLPIQMRMTSDGFLQWAAENEGFYEFHDGEVVAIEGFSRDHQEIVTQLGAGIGIHLGRSALCRAYFRGLAVRVESTNEILYPDLLATGDPRDHADPRVVRHPGLIIEVLSDSTRDYDQGDKFRSYKHLEALREYLLIDTIEQVVSLHRRVGDRKWESDEFGPGESFDLTTIGLRVDVSDLYDRTDVPAPRPRPREVTPS